MNQENINSSASSDSNEISLKELILKVLDWYKYLLSKWIIFLFFGLLGAVIGFFYAYKKEPVYVASTNFVLEEEKGNGLGSLAGIASLAGVDLGQGGGGIFQGDNILELYKSRSMIEKTLLTSVISNGKNELLIDYYIKFNRLKEKWDKEQILTKELSFNRNIGAKLVRTRDSLMTDIIENLNKNCLFVAKPDKKLSIIRVEVRSKDEFFAKNFNEQIVSTVNEFYVLTKTKRSKENVEILQLKSDSVRRVMDGAIYSAARVADITPNLNPTRQIQRNAPIQRSQFSAETNKLILGELVKNLEMSKIALLKEKPLIQVVDQPIYPLEKIELTSSKGMVLGVLIFETLLMGFLILKRIISNSLN